MKRRIIGIDPGLAGGLAVLDLGDGDELLEATLMRTPVLRTRRRARDRIEYDAPAMLAWLVEAADGGTGSVQVVLEEQQAMPAALRGRHQGGMSTFRTGVGYGLWLGLVTAARVPYEIVRPADWKKHHKLVGCDKRASRLRCGQLFPALAPIAAQDEGPAEALLLAAYAAAALARRGP